MAYDVIINALNNYHLYLFTIVVHIKNVIVDSINNKVILRKFLH